MNRRKLSLPTPFGPADLMAAARNAAAQALGATRSTAEVAGLAADGAGWIADAMAGVEERLPPAQPVACRERCAFCCHLKVLATAPEVLRLAEHLRATHGREELAALRERVARADEATNGMTTGARARAKLPCPLLVDGRCAGYEARPFACRGANSLDAGQCERAFERPDEPVDLPVYKAQLQVAEAVRAGLAGGAAARGLDGRLFELNAALRIALEEPRTGAAWAEGRPALADALDAEFEAAMRQARAPGPPKA